MLAVTGWRTPAWLALRQAQDSMGACGVAVTAIATIPSLLPWASSSSTTGSHHHQQQQRTFASGQLHVLVEPLGDQHEGISVVTLNRPDARNAIGRQLLRELREAINNLRQERTTRCVIIRSAVPGVFCSGADLKERAMMTQHEAGEFVTSIRQTFSDLQAMPVPTIAAMEGYALGGGAELAISCDLRVVSSTAVVGFPEAQLGIIPGAGGTQRLPRLVGMAKAKELIFTARRVKPDEALRVGLADHAVEEGQAYNKALEIAAEMARCAPLSLRMAKEAIAQGMNVDLATGLRIEQACYAQLLPTKDRVEGLKAFAEKRQPRYMGE
mmetsp:Transcript_31075/g.68998  ORF Transcript_31075/g.68998 Transcript_31075/m.68998 type:complete len:326 (-) Transcript_31075:284-1261(-)|eukprot:CAMPEP_0202900516 /NCGR_PEP_ID=MMETSP1392-20130828/11878_1 /ASSEMBLY_ACC=CAM_ASM_000868 /TAXON_ID=225041 /ORGANISM="Chlamydomonas chlamydogama, Strain SAG 11-48b" /LENGTH=325 /DNA_ID=CAMNT_0049586921 /DNA_START=442 /DNA_END=1419 /DNA_ORIENTATION=+